LTKARDWYESQRPALGGEFISAVEEVFDRISETPELYAPEYRNVRRVKLPRFSFIVYYRIIPSGLEVLAVQHGSANPRKWRSRA
jgi:plasmid stabilization system protein ParE